MHSFRARFKDQCIRLRLGAYQLFEPRTLCMFLWRLFFFFCIIIGCLSWALVVWYYPLVVWPRQETRFYDNLRQKQLANVSR